MTVLLYVIKAYMTVLLYILREIVTVYKDPAHV
jgi:hypothetical protein